MVSHRDNLEAWEDIRRQEEQTSLPVREVRASNGISDSYQMLTLVSRKFKAELWSKLAEEMAVPWRAAESMHWQLGKQDITSRAGVVPLSLSSTATNPATTSNHCASIPYSQPKRGSTSRAISGHLPSLPSIQELTSGVPAYAAALPRPNFKGRKIYY